MSRFFATSDKGVLIWDGDSITGAYAASQRWFRHRTGIVTVKEGTLIRERYHADPSSPSGMRVEVVNP